MCKMCEICKEANLLHAVLVARQKRGRTLGKDFFDSLIESASSKGLLKHSIKAEVPNAKFTSSRIALGFLPVLLSASTSNPPSPPRPNSAPTAEIGLMASLDQIENDFDILDGTCFYSMQLA